MPATPTAGPAGSSWRRLGGTAPALLRSTRLDLHHAAQLLAAFGQTWVEARADDSHRSMTWDREALAFRSEASVGGLRAGLDPGGFVLRLFEGGEALDALDLRGRTPQYALSWMRRTLSTARGGGRLEMTWPEYDLPERTGGVEAPLRPDAEVLAELAAWYGNAERALAAFARLPEASVVRCWPHHFDLATLLTFQSGDPGGEQKHIGVGFSPGDASRSEPYYYVNAWPAPPVESLPALEGPGSWNTEGWVGAVLDAEAVVAGLDAADQEATVVHFLNAAVDALRVTVLLES